MELTKQEHENGGVLDMDTETVSTITSHGPGYIDENLEKVVGVQTDKPFNRSFSLTVEFGWQKLLLNLMDIN